MVVCNENIIMKRNLKNFNAALKSVGQSCPNCGEIEVTKVRNETGFVKNSPVHIETMGCWKCNARWENFYEFVDIRIIRDQKIPTSNTDNSGN